VVPVADRDAARGATRDADRDAARAAKERLHADLAGLPGLGGIGIGRRHGAWVVTVRVEVEDACVAVPDVYGGVPVEVRVTGPVRALTTPDVDPPAADHPGSRHPPVALPRHEAGPPAPGPGAGT
jgi:hypothetical protein